MSAMKSRQQLHQEKLKAAGACVVCGKCRACGEVSILQAQAHNCRKRARSTRYCPSHAERQRARQRARVIARKLNALQRSLEAGS